MIIYTKKAASSTSPSMTLSIMGVVVQLFYGTGTFRGWLSVFRKFSPVLKGENNVCCFSNYVLQGDIFIHPVPAVI